jgi:hypothetical protein
LWPIKWLYVKIYAGKNHLRRISMLNLKDYGNSSVDRRDDISQVRGKCRFVGNWSHEEMERLAIDADLPSVEGLE